MPATRSISHYDLDAFFVSVECRNNPRLLGKPVIVGGQERGVVACCSYEARKFGVHSAMPMKVAKRLCPQALIVSGDYENYSKESALVTEIIQSKVPVVEKASIDEFYIDLTGMDKFHGCYKFSRELKQTITRYTGLPISFALAANKLVSKVGTNEVKPNGQLEIPFGDEKGFLAPLEVKKLPMIGEKTGLLLNQRGVKFVYTLAQMKLPMLQQLFGKNGTEMWRRANGIDDSPIVQYREQKSISSEETFGSDTANLRFLEAEIVRLTEKVAFDLRSDNRLAGCIAVKIRYGDFVTEVKQRSINYTNADDVLLDEAKKLFRALFTKRMMLRLVGVKLSQLIPGNYQVSLFDDTQEKIKLYQSIDSIKAQYGQSLVRRGSSFF